MESILTRAVYRALNNTGSNQLVNAEQLTYPANVDKVRLSFGVCGVFRKIARLLAVYYTSSLLISFGRFFDLRGCVEVISFRYYWFCLA